MRPSSPLLYIKQPPNLYIDLPVVLEDEELYTPKPIPKAISVSVNASANPASRLSNRL
jgi:hypothetical protein